MDGISALCKKKFCSESLSHGLCLPPCKEAQTVEAGGKCLQVRRELFRDGGMAYGCRATGQEPRLAPGSPHEKFGGQQGEHWAKSLESMPVGRGLC